MGVFIDNSVILKDTFEHHKIMSKYENFFKTHQVF